LRTSEALYLQESFVFYDAIRSRYYFKDVADAQSAPLMIKKLRYYARFVVVCLLLDRRDYVQDLLKELGILVDEYQNNFNPPDFREWHEVVRELREFLEADDLLDVVGLEGRAKPSALLPLQTEGDVKIELQHAVLVGNCEDQLKFSELTLDIFRMLLTIEAPAEQSPRHNPHKHLLYRPSVGQLSVVLASICKDLPESAAVMLYVSADQWQPPAGQPYSVPCSAPPQTGLNLAVRSSDPAGTAISPAACGLHPEDIIPWTRRPFVLVADSPGSTCFMDVKNMFGMPLLCLLSPEVTPQDISGPDKVGNLFTLFLNAPLIAMWVALKQDGQLEKETFDKAEAKLSEVMSTIQGQLKSAPDLDDSIRLFITDQLVCNLILRFIFFQALTKLHTSFKAQAEFAPKSNPPMPDVASNEEVAAQVLELAELLGDTEYMQKD